MIFTIPLSPVYIQAKGLPVWGYILDGLVILAAAAIWGVFFWLAWQWIRKGRATTQSLTLDNRSNLTTRFRMGANLGKMEKHMALTWWLDDQEFKASPVETVSYVAEKVTPPTRKSKPEVTPDKKTAAVEKTPTAKKSFKPDKIITQVRGKFRGVRSFGSVIANLTSAIAALLPSSLKKPFTEVSNSIRSTQQTMDSAVAKPKALTEAGKQVQANVGRLNQSTGGAFSKGGIPGSSGGSAAAGNPSAGGNSTAKGSASSAYVQPEVEYRRVVTIQQVLETVPLNPGEHLDLRLQILPKNPFRKLEGEFSVSSLQMEETDLPPQELLKPHEVLVKYLLPAPPPRTWAGFILFCLSIMIVNASWTILLVRWINRLLS